MKRIIVTSFYCLLYFFAHGQEAEGKIVPSINGPAGNYLYIVSLDDLSERRVSKTDVFLIERIEKETATEETSESSAVKIGECTQVNTYKELKTYFSSEDLAELKEMWGDISDNEVLSKFTEYESLDSIAFIYPYIETRRALGHVYLDDNVKTGYYYIYKITKIAADGEETLWGYSYTKGGMGNYILPHLKPRWADASGKDSLVKILWTVALSEEQFEAIPLGKEVSEENYNKQLHHLPFRPTNLRAKVMVAAENGYEERGVITPTYSEQGDSLYFQYYQTEVEEEYLKSYIILQDEVYNEGIPSDTAIVFSEDSTTIDIIYDITVTDTLNGIHIAWDPLPARAYYAGIEITKYDSDDVQDSVVVLSPHVSSYIDRSIAVGHYYRYHVKALFVPQAGLEQRLAAQGTGSFSKFTKPLPPVNLTGKPIGDYINLEWEAIDEPSIYGYFIYRGTSPQNLTLADGPIFQKSYTDSLSSLSGRTHYHYAVASQNYGQDTSQYSNIVSVRPTKSITMVNPPSVNTYYANGTIRLDWRDVRGDDNIIESYMLQRKTDKSDQYVTIHDSELKKPSFEDTDIKQGTTYYYRVAAKSIYGDMTPYSEGTVYTVAHSKVPTINKFFVRNVTEGVKITLPNIIAKSRKSYNIYRRLASEEKFAKLTTIPADQFSYLDSTTQPDTYYVYVITLTNMNNQEGARGQSVTVHTN